MKQIITIRKIPTNISKPEGIKYILENFLKLNCFIQSFTVVDDEIICVLNQTVTLKNSLSTLTNKRSRK